MSMKRHRFKYINQSVHHFSPYKPVASLYAQ